MTVHIMRTERLEFVLPDFVRLAWTSDIARETWAARFQRVIRAWATTELLASAYGVRKCALVTIPRDNLPELESSWKSRDLVALELAPIAPADSRLSVPPSSDSGDPPIVSRFAVGKIQHVSDFYEAWKIQNSDKIGELLGYPPCCRAQFYNRCVVDNLLDPIWSMAADGGANGVSRFTIEIDSPMATNVLWRSIGIRAVPHLPCRFDCHATVDLSKRFLEAAICLGFTDEMDWLRQILSWPVEWSVLHGIAEIKTPILKICTRTDATKRKFTVQWIGQTYPKEGAQGLSFPYKSLQQLKITESLGFKRGLVQLATQNPAPDIFDSRVGKLISK